MTDVSSNDSYLTCNCATCSSPSGPDCALLRRAWDETTALRAQLAEADRRLAELEAERDVARDRQLERDDVIRELSDALREAHDHVRHDGWMCGPDACAGCQSIEPGRAALARADALGGEHDR